MITEPHIWPCWSTSSFGHEANTSPQELAALSQHLDLCRRAKGGFFALQCHGETMLSVVSGKVVTTLIVSLMLLGIASLLL
jgi:hypothetical protein